MSNHSSSVHAGSSNSSVRRFLFAGLTLAMLFVSTFFNHRAHAQERLSVEGSPRERVRFELVLDGAVSLAVQSASPDPSEHFGTLRLMPSLRLILPEGLGFYVGANVGGFMGSSALATAGVLYQVPLSSNGRISFETSLGVEAGEAKRGEANISGFYSCTLRECASTGDPYGARPDSSLLVGGVLQGMLNFEVADHLLLGAGVQARVHSVQGMRNVGVELAPVIRIGGTF